MDLSLSKLSQMYAMAITKCSGIEDMINLIGLPKKKYKDDDCRKWEDWRIILELKLISEKKSPLSKSERDYIIYRSAGIINSFKLQQKQNNIDKTNRELYESDELLINDCRIELKKKNNIDKTNNTQIDIRKECEEQLREWFSV